MSDAPERITVTIDDGSLFLEGEPTDEMIGRFWGHVEYVRADLFAELEARLATAADIIEAADHRALATDGPVGHCRDEMTNGEWRQLYLAVKGEQAE